MMLVFFWKKQILVNTFYLKKLPYLSLRLCSVGETKNFKFLMSLFRILVVKENNIG